MEVKEIIYFGQKAKVICDGNCEKAWGINNRPKVQIGDNEDEVDQKINNVRKLPTLNFVGHPIF